MNPPPESHIPSSPPPPARSRGKLAGVVLLVLLVAGVAWWRLSPSDAGPPLPPLPANLDDPEVIEAVTRAREAVSKAPKSAEAWGRLGMVMLAQDFEKDADGLFATASQLDPADAKWHYGRAVIANKRDPETALGLLRETMAAPGHGAAGQAYRTTAALLLAEALLTRGELDEAEKLFAEEVSRNRRSPRAAFGLGLVAVARGNGPLAAERLSPLRTSNNARKKATSQLAVLARARGDVPAAAAFEKEAAAFPPDLTWPDPLGEEVLPLKVGRRERGKEADRLEQAGRFADAAALYLRQLETDPTVRAYLGAGANLSRTGDYDRGVPLLREAVKRAADDPAAHYTLALMQFARAEQEWQVRPGAEHLKEFFREVAAHAKRAAELKSDHAQAYLFWGLSLKYLGDAAAAVEPLRKGVAVRPEEYDLQFALGEALLASGKAAEAKAHFENARRIDPKDPRAEKALKQMGGG